MHHDQNAAMSDYRRLYDAVRADLAQDDLSFANVEFPVVPDKAPSGYPLFNGSVSYVRAAVAAGFDVFSLANNHTFDWGPAGVAATLRVFDELSEADGIHHNGIRRARMAPIEPTVIHRNGWSVAFVSITALSNVRGSAPYIHLVDYARAEESESFLALVAEWDAAYDLVIIGVHGGTEYTAEPDRRKAEFFRELVERGADIVWGHHPHVLQPVEIVRTGSSRKLILHSTGNFVSAQRRYQRPELPLGRWAPTGDTALFSVRVSRMVRPDGSHGAVSVTVLRTPLLTVHEDPLHGFVPRRFGSLLGEPLPLAWRAFYLARYAVTRSFVNNRRESFVALKISGPKK